jgi:4-hydroxy-2-oxoheptanedioate aldolase
MNQWFAKQALDIGAYGIVWPHVDTVEQAYNAVGACRYPRLPEAARYEPKGLRGDAPNAAARYWGLTNQEYYAKADVWPLDPNGEILVVLMIESTQAISNLRDMLKQVPGIGCILIGEGDLSQELGHPRDYDYPTVAEAKHEVVRICKELNVPVGHPHVDSDNVEAVLEEGYRFLMPGAGRSYAGLTKGRQLAGRA